MIASLVAVALLAASPAPILSQISLHDGGSYMQGFARTSPAGTWVFTQVMQAGRFGQSYTWHAAHGDLTLTHVTADGKAVLSWMYLRGFGHGQALSLQPAHPGFWVWIEAVPHVMPNGGNGFGTKIARFRWHAGATITPASPGVHLYDPHPGTYMNSPSLSPGGGLIAARYMNPDGTTATDVYHLAEFLARDYSPILHIPQPPLPKMGQGWALMPTGDQIAWLTGGPYTAANPKPGNATLTVFGAEGVISQELLTAGLNLTRREPEGVQSIAGRICYGFASGPASTRRASVYCQ